jgi:hypothetical protein
MVYLDHIFTHEFPLKVVVDVFTEDNDLGFLHRKLERVIVRVFLTTIKHFLKVLC